MSYSKEPVYFVRWVDSTQTEPGWVERSDITYDTAAECNSVGFLVKHNKSLHVFANSVDVDNGNLEGVFTIPTVAIIELIQLR